MEEQKNLNTAPVNQPAGAVAPKNIPTAAGALIILAIAVIVGTGIMYIFPADFSGSYYTGNPAILDKPLKPETETINTKEKEVISPVPAEKEPAQPTAGTTVDFDYELKKLDDQNNSISADDFSENEMADANVGL